MDSQENFATTIRAVAITGGIGSGKSVISKILSSIGFTIIDCDLVARQLMDESEDIHQKLLDFIHPDAVSNGIINRPIIASVVFNDSEKLSLLNSWVHSAVKDVIRKNIDDSSPDRPVFIETAILYQSGIDKMVDAVIEVLADRETRIQRVIYRNSINREDVISRMESQILTDYRPHPKTYMVDNNPGIAVLPQIEAILEKLAIKPLRSKD